ncbi:hypothetical protein N7470_002442 [Penicillium chermesinum]|nr:hypothetical protein N7470_002442 [Penicillium chermesinum]
MDFHLVPRGTDRNYTGFLTKTIVYVGSLILFLASFALTLSSIIIPKWVSYHSEKVSTVGYLRILYMVPPGQSPHCVRSIPRTLVKLTESFSAPTSLLLRTQSSLLFLTDTCESFPQREDCHGENRYFCSMWRSVGFLMSFTVVLQGISIVAYLIILAGGKRLRENGWRILSILIVLSAIVQATSMSIVAYLFDNEDRFFVGWQLDESWIFCTVSWCIGLVCAGAIAIAAHTLPSEGGYELIPDHDES